MTTVTVRDPVRDAVDGAVRNGARVGDFAGIRWMTGGFRGDPLTRSVDPLFDLLVESGRSPTAQEPASERTSTTAPNGEPRGVGGSGASASGAVADGRGCSPRKAHAEPRGSAGPEPRQRSREDPDESPLRRERTTDPVRRDDRDDPRRAPAVHRRMRSATASTDRVVCRTTTPTRRLTGPSAREWCAGPTGPGRGRSREPGDRRRTVARGSRARPRQVVFRFASDGVPGWPHGKPTQRSRGM